MFLEVKEWMYSLLQNNSNLNRIDKERNSRDIRKFENFQEKLEQQDKFRQYAILTLQIWKSNLLLQCQ